MGLVGVGNPLPKVFGAIGSAHTKKLKPCCVAFCSSEEAMRLKLSELGRNEFIASNSFRPALSNENQMKHNFNDPMFEPYAWERSLVKAINSKVGVVVCYTLLALLILGIIFW